MEKSFKDIYSAKDVIDIELAGFKVISTLIELFTDAVMNPNKAYSQLLIDLYHKINGNSLPIV